MLHSSFTRKLKDPEAHCPRVGQAVAVIGLMAQGSLIQMSEATLKRPAVLSTSLLEVLNEFLAFRHLFRGASIALMRWDKLYPLVAKVDCTYEHAKGELEAFTGFVEQHAGKA